MIGLNLDVTKTGCLLGILAAIAVFLLTIFRQKRLDLIDLGSFTAAYLSASNIAPAIFLCWYVFDPDPDSVKTKLHGYEKYVAFAGLSLVFLTLISLWAVCKKAYV